MPFCLWQKWSDAQKKRILYTFDSVSSLQTIYGFNLDSDLVQKFLKEYTILEKNGKNIILCWIPSHVGILGNRRPANSQEGLSKKFWWHCLLELGTYVETYPYGVSF